MTSREEYEQAILWINTWFVPIESHPSQLAVRVLRALADGAVLCREIEFERNTYVPLDPQP